MAHRERHECEYTDGVRAELVIVGRAMTAVVTGADVSYAPSFGTTVNAAKRQIDRLVGRPATTGWRTVRECFVCLSRPVTITPLEHGDVSAVDCPSCGHYTLTGTIAKGCQTLHDTVDGGANIADVARYFSAASRTSSRLTLSTTTFPHFAREGRRLVN